MCLVLFLRSLISISLVFLNPAHNRPVGKNHLSPPVVFLQITVSQLDTDQYFKSFGHALFLHFDCMVQHTQLSAICRHMPF